MGIKRTSVCKEGYILCSSILGKMPGFTKFHWILFFFLYGYSTDYNPCVAVDLHSSTPWSMGYFKFRNDTIHESFFLWCPFGYNLPPLHTHTYWTPLRPAVTKNGHTVLWVSQCESMMAEKPTALVLTSLMIPASTHLCAFDSQSNSAVTSQRGRAKNRIEQPLT